MNASAGKAPTREEAAEAIDMLSERIRAHDKRYYQQDAPTITDMAYDALRKAR